MQNIFFLQTEIENRFKLTTRNFNRIVTTTAYHNLLLNIPKKEFVEFTNETKSSAEKNDSVKKKSQV